MMVLARGIRRVAAVVVVLWMAPAAAQENLYANKSAAQIFATDCAMCHKQPAALAKAGGPLGLGMESFLRSHYTASRESAAFLAKYIQAMDAPSAAPERKRAKPAAKKPADAKAGDVKPVSETKPAETKPAEATPAEAAKPAEAKPAEPKSE